jgi:hypothetical protein
MNLSQGKHFARNTDAKVRSKNRDLSERQQKLLRLLQTKRREEEIGFWTCFRVFLHLSASKARLQTMNVTVQSVTEENGLFLFHESRENEKETYQRISNVTAVYILFTSNELVHWFHIPMQDNLQRCI